MFLKFLGPTWESFVPYFVPLAKRSASPGLTILVLSVLYTMFFCNRIIFGNLNTNYIMVYKDMTFREFSTLLPLFVLTITLGFYPDLIFDTILTSVSMNIEQQKYL